jgi:hypothetical protein
MLSELNEIKYTKYNIMELKVAKLIESPNLRERVYEILKKSIILQEIPLGEKIDEEFLANRFGVSRTPIREALRPCRSPAKRKALAKLEQYVANHAEMLDYPSYLAKGYDIGSGPTESLCGTLTARLRGGGKRWLSPNAEALMALAALQHSRLWKTYWTPQARQAG